MKRTITWPPRIVGGRLAMTEDPARDPQDPSAALRQVIRLSLMDGRSGHAWNERQGLGLNDPTFAPSSGATRARIGQRVREVFTGLERNHRAKLAASTFNTTDPATLSLVIEFTNLETGGRESMEIARG
jgi:hypothetical protein